VQPLNLKPPSAAFEMEMLAAKHPLLRPTCYHVVNSTLLNDSPIHSPLLGEGCLAIQVLTKGRFGTKTLKSARTALKFKTYARSAAPRAVIESVKISQTVEDARESLLDAISGVGGRGRVASDLQKKVRSSSFCPPFEPMQANKCKI
jgi:hypothetical protein